MTAILAYLALTITITALLNGHTLHTSWNDR